MADLPNTNNSKPEEVSKEAGNSQQKQEEIISPSGARLATIKKDINAEIASGGARGATAKLASISPRTPPPGAIVSPSNTVLSVPTSKPSAKSQQKQLRKQLVRQYLANQSMAQSPLTSLAPPKSSHFGPIRKIFSLVLRARQTIPQPQPSPMPSAGTVARGGGFTAFDKFASSLKQSKQNAAKQGVVKGFVKGIGKSLGLAVLYGTDIARGGQDERTRLGELYRYVGDDIMGMLPRLRQGKANWLRHQRAYPRLRVINSRSDLDTWNKLHPLDKIVLPSTWINDLENFELYNVYFGNKEQEWLQEKLRVEKQNEEAELAAHTASHPGNMHFSEQEEEKKQEKKQQGRPGIFSRLKRLVLRKKDQEISQSGRKFFWRTTTSSPRRAIINFLTPYSKEIARLVSRSATRGATAAAKSMLNLLGKGLASLARNIGLRAATALAGAVIGPASAVVGFFSTPAGWITIGGIIILFIFFILMGGSNKQDYGVDVHIDGTTAVESPSASSLENGSDTKATTLGVSTKSLGAKTEVLEAQAGTKTDLATYTITVTVRGSADDVIVTLPIHDKAEFVKASLPCHLEEGRIIWNLAQNPSTTTLGRCGEQVSTAPTTQLSPPSQMQRSTKPTIYNMGFGPSNATRIANMIRSLRANSPYLGHESEIIEFARETGLDPLMIIVSFSESQLCTDGLNTPFGSSPPNYNCMNITWEAALYAQNNLGMDLTRWGAKKGSSSLGHNWTFIPTMRQGIGFTFDFFARRFKGMDLETFWNTHNPCSDPQTIGTNCGSYAMNRALDLLRTYAGPPSTGPDAFVGDGSSFPGGGSGMVGSGSYQITVVLRPKPGVNNEFLYEYASAKMINPRGSTSFASDLGNTTDTSGLVNVGTQVGAPPNTNTCGGKYSLNNPMGKNFGDPNCDFTKDAFYNLLKQYDPANADYWFTVVVPCESPGYDPNLYYRCGAAGCTPDPAGAWGLFQMGRGRNGEYDHGDVAWPQQTLNATTYRKNAGKWNYWACARDRWT